PHRSHLGGPRIRLNDYHYLCRRVFCISPQKLRPRRTHIHTNPSLLTPRRTRTIHKRGIADRKGSRTMICKVRPERRARQAWCESRRRVCSRKGNLMLTEMCSIRFWITLTVAALSISPGALSADDQETQRAGKVVRLVWFPRFSPDGKWLITAHGSW